MWLYFDMINIGSGHVVTSVNIVLILEKLELSLSLGYGYGYTDSKCYSLWMDLFDELYMLCLLVSECYCGLGTSGFTIKVIFKNLVIWCNTLKFPIEFECSH